MPRIKPFKGIRPGKAFVNQVVLEMENLSREEAKQIRMENQFSFVHLLIPKIENRFLLGSKTELAFKKINENFEEFLDLGVLISDPEPSVYIYQISHAGKVQTGIWTVTSIDDYLNNTVRKHELTREDREKSLIYYLQQTGIDANPVLITYLPLPRIQRLISEATEQAPVLFLEREGSEHKLWKIDSEPGLQTLIDAFSTLPSSYIADGHHRAAAASLLGIERRKLNLKHRGDEEYNFFSSVYMAVDQLTIYEFNRLITDLNGLSTDEFLIKISACFAVELRDRGHPVLPDKPHTFGMYLNGNWYLLTAKSVPDNNENPVSALDVSILQDLILSPILALDDPRADPRISFFGGKVPIEDLIEKVDSGEFKIAFTLFPTSINELIRVADAGEVMPPKSTWFEPKIPAGLLIHQVS